MTSPATATGSEAVLQVRAVPGLARFEAAEWDACATSPETLSAGDETFNPFVSHAFLSALEKRAASPAAPAGCRCMCGSSARAASSAPRPAT